MRDQQRTLIRGTLQVIKKEAKYLLRLETTGINAGYWIFPGGDFDIKEDENRKELGFECSTRETEEEIGITPLNPRLRAVIFFDNRKRIFPGKTEIASFDYQAFYYYSTDYAGVLRDIGPDGRKQGLFTYEEALKLSMHPGDRKILNALEMISSESVFEGVIVHNKSDLESATFQVV